MGDREGFEGRIVTSETTSLVNVEPCPYCTTEDLFARLTTRPQTDVPDQSSQPGMDVGPESVQPRVPVGECVVV